MSGKWLRLRILTEVYRSLPGRICSIRSPRVMGGYFPDMGNIRWLSPKHVKVKKCAHDCRRLRPSDLKHHNHCHLHNQNLPLRWYGIFDDFLSNDIAYIGWSSLIDKQLFTMLVLFSLLQPHFSQLIQSTTFSLYLNNLTS